MTVVGKQAEHPRTMICGVRFSCLDRQGAAEWLAGAATRGAGGYVCVTGAHGVVSAQDDAVLRTILNGAAMNTLDGQPVVWIARLRGFMAGRVTGRELVWDVVDLDRGAEIKHVLFGATAAVTDKMTERLRERSPTIKVEAYNPPFGPLSDEDLDAVCARFSFPGPMIVWVGLSTPKQEQLTVRLSARFPHVPIVAIGAGFDFVAGLKPVAPAFVTSLSLEWLFRLLSEPRRLFWRYAEIVPRFLWLVGREAVSGSLFARSETAAR
jgi:N-acetylglucosaminyldiphosphoundecaprenol N-acetyl-beta-D-mannosaminyltransferase